MKDIVLTNNCFDPPELAYWRVPLNFNGTLSPDYCGLYDQNGYDLTEAEKLYAQVNATHITQHRIHRHALKREWFVQDLKTEGAILNHSLLFERKGFEGSAREQLEMWSRTYPIFNKLLKQRPKWGLDFSIDYCDNQGNVFEALHWEYDGFDYNEILDKKKEAEQILLNTDWDDVGRSLLNKKHEWFDLDFFSQSDYKCNFVGICSERFKMVIWE